MEYEVNEEKRNKFIESAGKRVNNVIHSIEILEPMARSNVYDFSKNDVEAMFSAMQDALDSAKEEYMKKFEEKAKSSKKVFEFGSLKAKVEEVAEVSAEIIEENNTDLNDIQE